jgi:hypothetical protein
MTISKLFEAGERHLASSVKWSKDECRYFTTVSGITLEINSVTNSCRIAGIWRGKLQGGSLASLKAQAIRRLEAITQKSAEAK